MKDLHMIAVAMYVIANMLLYVISLLLYAFAKECDDSYKKMFKATAFGVFCISLFITYTIMGIM